MAEDLRDEPGGPRSTATARPTPTARCPPPVTSLVSPGASDHWKVSVDGTTAPRSEVFGWANQFDVDQAGAGRLTYDTPITRRLLLVGQIVLWLVAFVAWRRRPRRPPARRGRA